MSRKITAGKAMSILLIVVLFTVVAVASVIHVFNWGNKPEAEEEVFKSSQ